MEKDELNELSFEEAISQLELIVRELESGRTKLDDAVSAYEKAIKLKQREIEFEKQMAQYGDEQEAIKQLEAKAKQNNLEYILKVGLAYLYGNIVSKDINKAKLYLNKYLKSLEPYINEENKSKLGSYISIYESV